jgi:hypothetical protein
MLKTILKEAQANLSWSIFSVGVTQLVFKLSGPVNFLVAIMGCAVVIGAILARTPHLKSSAKLIATAELYCSLLILIGNMVFNYLIMLKGEHHFVLGNIMASLLFFAVALLSSAITSKLFNVA